MWALTASTLSSNSRSKPLVTASTTTREATPSTSPIIDTVVNTENTRSSANSKRPSPPSRVNITPRVSSSREWPRPPNSAARPSTVNAAVTIRPARAVCELRARSR
jgi:hypothetical protein